MVLVAVVLAVPERANATETVQECGPGQLRDAIASADPGETVEFACDGTIALNDPSQTFEILKDLTLDAAGRDVVIDGTGTARLFFLSGGGKVTMRGLTLRSGAVTNPGNGLGGGAVAVANTTFRAEDMRFVGNYAQDQGGAIGTFGNVASVEIVDSVFVGNSAGCGTVCQDGGGGAIAIIGGRPSSITGSTFRDNSMAGRGGGGAILGKFTFNPARAGSISITDSTFAGNVASPLDDGDRPARGGGAVAVYNHPLSISASTFTGNRVTPALLGFGARGGAVQIGGQIVEDLIGPQPATIADSVFEGNAAIGNGADGGAINAAVHPTEIRGVQVLDNSADGVGGGIVAFGPVALADSLLRGNRAAGNVNGTGGGIWAGRPITVSGTDVLGSEPDGCDLFESEGTTLGAIVDGGDNFESPGSSCAFAAIARPALSVDDIDLGEPAAGDTTRAPFTVTLTRAPAFPLEVGYATADGSALAGQDYVAATGTVTIPAGAKEARIPVEALPDSGTEGSEAFTLTLSLPADGRAQIADGTGRATVVEPSPPAASAPPAATAPPAAGGAPPVYILPAPTTSPTASGPPVGTLRAGQSRLERRIRVSFACDQRCDATLVLSNRGRRLGRVTDDAGAGDAETVVFELRARDWRRLRAKARRRGSVIVRLRGRFADADGASAAEIAFRLRRG